MRKLWSIYHRDILFLFNEFSSTPLIQRLKSIGMNCGLEYTQFELFKNVNLIQDMITVLVRF